jgi:hypothetical protein
LTDRDCNGVATAVRNEAKDSGKILAGFGVSLDSFDMRHDTKPPTGGRQRITKDRFSPC